MIVGLHGVLQRNPWFNRVVEQDAESSVEEDLLNFVIDRADSYGWQTTNTWLTESGRDTACHKPTAWAHEEVGGDWTDDNEVHQLGWLQGGVLTAPLGPALPVRPIALVLSEALARVGEVTFTGLHALLPLQAVERNTAFHPAVLAPWFRLADPDIQHEIVVTVSTRPAECRISGDDVLAVRDAMRDMAGEVVDVSMSVTRDDPPGLDLDLGRALHTEGMREVMRLGCRTHEWSPDVAVWLVEMVADGLRSTGRLAPFVITASSAPTVA
ncbi:hypothetical protein [Streptomyces buecherae]|uniref:Uncharacterized protein n=1 Tax=Streptomyces buecherae TaxID=2763006 RepID=A0A7H8NAG3_9ACTN|nr:hypothetical protein [Streptomyces buecherae]QKW51529.1 hypothetical protein HUT08_20600 [Streptomyces buecherae]